ncbi:hypothetical protein CAPGI0001_2435 [Capnocytophaga gingivalis ATCC 33624]|nr:hypothetical protein CAPGI0001_2435 [Capnocytophaga gingivalis ATCC 33624]
MPSIGVWILKDAVLGAPSKPTHWLRYNPNILVAPQEPV